MTVNFRIRHLLYLSALILLASCVALREETRAGKVAPVTAGQVHVKSGLEVFLENHAGFPGDRVALMTNQTAVDHELVHAVRLLQGKVDLRLLLSPEHGLYGADYAGDRVEEDLDILTGIPTASTYGVKPEAITEMLEGIDVALFDVQDIGVRSYTYIYSMSYLMRAAAERGIHVVILDRPNPVTGVHVEGNVLEAGYESGVGRYPIPYRHGMTIGELALMFNEAFEIDCSLEIVKMEGWSRELWFDETDLPWVLTSPHVPHSATIMPMISTGVYGELHVLSEGVGTTIPFEFAGGPWIKDPFEFAAALLERSPGGVIFRPTFIKPYYGRFQGQVCGGVQIHVSDREIYKPYLISLLILSTHQELYPEVDLFSVEKRLRTYDIVTGCGWIREGLVAGEDPYDLEATWQPGLEDFLELREDYLLYN